MRICHYKDDFDHESQEVCMHLWNEPDFYEHTHDYWEIIVITSGRTDHILNGAVYTVQAGDCLFIRPSDIHEFRRIDEHPCTQVNVMATPTYMRNVMNNLNLHMYNAFKTDRRPLQLHPDKATYTKLQGFIDKFFFTHCAEDNETAIKFIINEMLNLFYYCYLYNATDRNYPECVNQLIGKMMSRHYISCSVSDILTDIPYSHVHLNRLFKQHTGQTIANYFLCCKFEYARKLLLSTDFTILAICQMIGYSSPAYFNNTFKKLYGYPPNKYRKGANKT